MAGLVMFEVLLELEGLAAVWVRTFEFSVWKMSSDMSLKIPSLGELSLAFVEGTVETSLMVLNLRLNLFDDGLIFLLSWLSNYFGCTSSSNQVAVVFSFVSVED